MTHAAAASDAAPVVFFPIRHHSPACALALLLAFEEIRPRQVLIEAPVDFAPLIPLLTDPATRPPVAILSLPPGPPNESDPEDAVRHPVTYPLCSHSPELVAIDWAARNGAAVALIDLPARHRAMRRRPAAEEPQSAPLIAEWRIDHNAYVAELCARRGVASPLALWDALFEAQAGTPDWRGFFESVGLYCRHIRDVSDPAELEAEGTLAREAQMAAGLAAARERGDSPIAVVTGGMHTPALRESLGRKVAPPALDGTPPPNAYLIRYGFRQLDHLGGYGAGLPHPGFYERFWQAIRKGPEELRLLPVAILADFADLLRRTDPRLAPATPALSAALLAAERLAALRDLPRPGRSELIEAVRSATLKTAAEAASDPLLGAFHDFLVGDAIGDLPYGLPQPPLVAAVRARAVAFGFNLEDGARRSRDLDLMRRKRHAAASRFLFALDLIEAGFARRTAGPDPMRGWRGDRLIESWDYAWSPMVEARLIARAGDGATLEETALAELRRRHAALGTLGRARSAVSCVALLVAAVRAGLDDGISAAVGWCAAALAEDPDAASIIHALGITADLARPGPGAPDLAPRFAVLRRQAFDRLLLLFPHLAETAAERLPELLPALATLAALLAEAEDATERERLAGALEEAMAAAPPPALHGALLAFGGLIGVLEETEVAARIAALLDGAYTEPGDAAAALGGCLAVAPRLIVRSEGLLGTVDAFLTRVAPEAFVGALPELRLAFSQLSPNEIDRVAAWVAARHGIAAEALRETAVTADEYAANLQLSARLAAIWQAEGLAGWLEVQA